jgi:phospholipid-binding lipoprotein MlaA
LIFNAIKNIAIKAFFMSILVVFCIFLTGCSSITVKNSVDPWESWNRSIFNFNDSLDTGIVKPIATVYTTGVPQFARTGVHNFFSNLTSPWTVINSALQLKPKPALDSFFRFAINTVFGFGGVLDIASEMNIERHTADFGQTLGHYGMPPGPYLVIPFLGSSTLRDTMASTLISRGDLVWQLESVAARNSLYALRLLDTRANLLRTTSVLEGVALDKYTFTRDIYLQVRRNDILDGKEPPEDPSEIPEFKENSPSPISSPSLEKPNAELEKKSELQLDEPLQNVPLMTSAAITEVDLTRLSAVLPLPTTEINGQTKPYASLNTVLNAN